MNDDSRRIDIPQDGLDTPYGYLYRPPGAWLQILALIAVFFGGPAVGWLVGQVPGDLSESARTALYVPFVLVFFIGYSVWVAQLNAIAFHGIGKSLLKALFLLMWRRQKPKSIHDVLPTREQLLEMMVKAQRAGASFRRVGWPVGILAGLCAMLFASDLGAWALFALTAGSTIGWGYVLGALGRRGWLPFMEEN